MVGDSIVGGATSRIAIILVVLAFTFVLFFLGSLWSAMRRAEGRSGLLSAVAFGTGLVAIAVKVAGDEPLFAAWYGAASGLDPQLARALQDMNNASFGLMLSATAVIVIRWVALPRWLGWVAVTGLGLFGALAVVVVSPSPPEWAILPMLFFLLWMVATSIALIRRVGETRQVETTRPAEQPARAR